IIFTHKVAGPIFKMKRLLREIGKGRLVIRERLRKGDELVHFFLTFEEMVQDLRDKQAREIAQLDGAIARLDQRPSDGQAGFVQVDAGGLADLRELRREMQA